MIANILFFMVWVAFIKKHFLNYYVMQLNLLYFCHLENNSFFHEAHLYIYNCIFSYDS